MIFLRALGCTPSLGGSRMIMSGFSSISSRTFKTSPAINSQLCKPFSSALTLAASTASSTISTPITFLATGAISCAMVPVPLYRSKTTLSAFPPSSRLPTYSLAVSYRTSAPKELVWKKEKVEILNFSPKSSSKKKSCP
ncbi:unknown [Firmicutes bacterium CAG:534]|nr:unknown [Firmicutes bacterium CAG:534]